MPICDAWILADNSEGLLVAVARKEEFENVIENNELWHIINKQQYES
jgi:hypothetical protein